jgi:hypothetical protein
MGAYSMRGAGQPKIEFRQGALTAVVMGAPFKRVHDLSETWVERTQLKERISMPQAKKHAAEEIISKLRAAELEIAKGRTTAETAKKIGVMESSDSHCPPCHTFFIR